MLSTRAVARSICTAVTITAGVAASVVWSSAAFADPQVTMAPANPGNEQVVVVSGSGFPSYRQDPTGLQALECADPGGSTANLPHEASRCEGLTINQGLISTDASGSFTTRYTIVKLTPQNSSIRCDSTHDCVLWVGVDYSQNFLGVHAFSAPFTVGGRAIASSSSSTPVAAIVIPVVAIAAGAAFLVARRSRRNSGTGATKGGPPPATSGQSKVRVGA